MIANYCKSYLGYLNKIVEECSNTYHQSICKKIYFEKFEPSQKAPKFSIGVRVKITKYKNILLNITLNNGQKKYL